MHSGGHPLAGEPRPQGRHRRRVPARIVAPGLRLQGRRVRARRRGGQRRPAARRRRQRDAHWLGAGRCDPDPAHWADRRRRGGFFTSEHETHGEGDDPGPFLSPLPARPQLRRPRRLSRARAVLRRRGRRVRPGASCAARRRRALPPDRRGGADPALRPEAARRGARPRRRCREADRPVHRSHQPRGARPG